MEDDFTIEALTAAINREPFVPGQVGALGFFDEDGVTTTNVKIEERDGRLDLIDPTPRGGPGASLEGDETRRTISFEVDHFEIPDAVMADEIQGVRMFGSDDDLETRGSSEPESSSEDESTDDEASPSLPLDPRGQLLSHPE